ncbi:hypothetical protein BLNAU_11579 [Blattamonas nauphoetae]|uniref:Tail specific protease domain-containing protein n=1 Tax=Blattamonas nauphoetae TaxID=2049346 RepID=A0ABQ9XQG4_9EUKA|nr:hypothetical protein BLNAU_11579 [Blattamonas nauphoetae]
MRIWEGNYYTHPHVILDLNKSRSERQKGRGSVLVPPARKHQKRQSVRNQKLPKRKATRDFEREARASRGYYTLEAIEECLAEIKYSPSDPDVIKTIEVFREYLNEYVFLDILRNPPDSVKIEKVDLIQELQDLPLSSFKTFSEFQKSLNGLLYKARDAHLRYEGPCSKFFTKVFPYSFEVDLSGNVAKLILTVSEYPGLTELYEQKTQVHLVGKVIDRISFTAEFNETQSPFEFIEEYSEKYQRNGKTPLSRFLNSLFVHLKQAELYTPTPDTLHFQIEGQNVAISRMVEYDSDIKASSVDELCPRLSNSTTNGVRSKEEYFNHLSQPNSSQTHYFHPELQLAHQSYQSLRKHHQLTKTQHLQTETSNNFIKPLFGDSAIVSYLVPSKSLGVLKIETFYLPDLSEFTRIAALSLKAFVDNNCSHVVLDLRSNTGGLSSLQSDLFNFLFPHIYPHTPLSDEPKTNFSDTVQRWLNTTREHSIYPDSEERFDVTATTVTKTFKHVSGDEYTRPYHPIHRISSDIPRISSAVREFWSPKQLKRKHPLFQSNQITIIVDGLCGSACAEFSKKVRSTGVGRVILLGSYPHKPVPDDMTEVDVGEFSGASVLSASTLDEIYETVNETYAFQRFPRKDTEMHFSFTQSYALIESDKLWEFTPVRPSSIIPYFKRDEHTDLERQGLIEAFYSDLGKCDPGMTRISSKCAKPPGKKHQSGQKCVNGHFSEDCTDIGCVYGYYLDHDRCKKIPKTMYDRQNMPAFFSIMFIFLGAGAASLVVLFLIFLQTVVKRKKSRHYIPLDDHL